MGIVRRSAVLAVCLGAAAAAPAAGAEGGAAEVRVASFTAPSAVVHGTPVVVSGRIAPGPGAVVIERLEGDAWRALRQVRADARGRFAAGLPLRRSSSLRASAVAADGSLVPGRRRFVNVRRRAWLRVQAPADQRIAGRSFRATGAVVPAARLERVTIEGARDGGRFRPLAAARLRGGRVDARFTPPAGGRWRFRLVAAPRPGRDAGAIAVAPAMEVFGSNPHGVPASAPHYLVQAISEMRLYYYQRGRLVRVFPVVFGKPSTPTPLGTYRVYSKTAGPGAAFGPLVLWYHRGYGIHGTNQEHLLARSWRYYSAGCTRNYNANILWLWPRVPIGTPVRNIVGG